MDLQAIHLINRDITSNMEMEDDLCEENGGIGSSERSEVYRTSVSREEVLGAWRFKAAGTDEIRSPRKGSEAWMAQASQRDMEFLTRALQRELRSRRSVENTVDASSVTDLNSISGSDANRQKIRAGGLQGWSDQSHNMSSDVASSASMSCSSEIDMVSRPGSPAHGMAGVGPAGPILDSSVHYRGGRNSSQKCSDTCDHKSNVISLRAVAGKISKKRSRASNKPPVTILKAEPANFREMVQQVTGVPLNIKRGANTIHHRAAHGEGSIPVLRPQPKRPNRIDYIPGLPTLDTSSGLNVMDSPCSYDNYLDQLLDNNYHKNRDNWLQTMRFGFDPAGDLTVCTCNADYFSHDEALKCPMHQLVPAVPRASTTLPLDFSIPCDSRIGCPSYNNGVAGRLVPLRALNIGYIDHGVSAESHQGGFAAPENSLLDKELLNIIHDA